MSLRPSLKILILQHPQEPHEKKGTVPLIQEHLTSVVVKTALSWPNLAKAIGETTEPGKWCVLYLGSGIKDGTTEHKKPGLYFVDKKSKPYEKPIQENLKNGLVGIVVLDGTWSQAKTLWWRNAWLLKLKRAILVPSGPSLYGKLRKEPRKECLSTLESLAESLTQLGQDPHIEKELKTVFKNFLGKTTSSSSEAYPSPS
jgi:DTW domain-containing protein YfiP